MDKRSNRNNYFKDHPYLSKKACQWLASKKIKLIALDCPQPDNPKNSKGSPCDAENHKVFLGKNIIIVEYLINLRKIKKDYLICLYAPLKLITGMDRQQDVLRWFNMEKLIEKVLKKKNINIKKKNFNSNFFQKELIDSIQFLEFISHIEKKFKVKFSNKDMSNQKFFSINGIIASLDKKLNANKKKLKRSYKKI